MRAGCYTIAALHASLDIAAEKRTATERLNLRELLLPAVPIEEYPWSAQAAIKKVVAAFRNVDVMLSVGSAYVPRGHEWGAENRLITCN